MVVVPSRPATRIAATFKSSAGAGPSVAVRKVAGRIGFEFRLDRRFPVSFLDSESSFFWFLLGTARVSCSLFPFSSFPKRSQQEPSRAALRLSRHEKIHCRFCCRRRAPARGRDFCRDLVWKWRGHLEREELESAPEGLAPLQLCDQSGVGRGPRKTRPEEE